MFTRQQLQKHIGKDLEFLDDIQIAMLTCNTNVLSSNDIENISRIARMEKAKQMAERARKRLDRVKLNAMMDGNRYCYCEEHRDIIDMVTQEALFQNVPPDAAEKMIEMAYEIYELYQNRGSDALDIL